MELLALIKFAQSAVDVVEYVDKQIEIARRKRPLTAEEDEAASRFRARRRALPSHQVEPDPGE